VIDVSFSKESVWARAMVSPAAHMSYVASLWMGWVKLRENLHKKTMAFYWEGCPAVHCPIQFMDHLKKMSFYGKNRGAGSWKKPAGIPGIPSINIYHHRNIPVLKGVNLQTPLLINQPMRKGHLWIMWGSSWKM
jgi:hypothetical protein